MTTPEAPQHPGIKPITDDAQLRYCNLHVLGPRQLFCRDNCKRLHETYPTSPDGLFLAARAPEGEVLLLWLLCTNPRQDIPRELWERRVPDAEAPEWARPTELLRPWLGPPREFGAVAAPAPGPTQAEELARAGAAVPPPRLPSPGDLGGLIGTAGVKLLEDLVAGRRVDLAGVIAVLVQGLGIAERIRDALAGLRDRVVAGVEPSLEATAGELAALNTQLGPTVGGGLQGIASTVLEIGRLQAQLTSQLTTEEGEKNRGALERVGAGVVGALEGALGPLVSKAIEVFQAAFKFMAEGMDKAGVALVDQIGGVYRDALEARAPVTVSNVSGVAGEALKNALSAGLAAQAAALLLELAHPLKRLGLNQVVGFIADFAGFGAIAGAFTGPSLKHGLQIPAEHRAMSVFRTNIPGPAEALEQAFQRHISLEDFAHILALHGFPSWWIKVVVDDTFVDPKTMDLARVLEDSEADPEWLALKLREVGWEDRDVAIGVKALILKTSAPARSNLISSAQREYRDGHLSLEELESALEGTFLRDELKDLYLRSARLQRRGAVMERVGTRVVRQYREDLLEREDAQEQLAGLGFVPEEVTALLLEADLERAIKQTKVEATEVKAQVRQIRSEALKSLKLQFRAGWVDREVFTAWGEALGYARSYLENVADLLLLQGPPAKIEERPAVGLGAVQEAAAVAARLLADEVAAGRVSGLRAQELLEELGLKRATARDVLAIAKVLGLPPPASLGIPVPDGRGGRLGWEAVLASVLGAVRGGQGGRDLLRDISTILGIPVTHSASRDPLYQLLEELTGRR